MHMVTGGEDFEELSGNCNLPEKAQEGVFEHGC